MYNIPTLADLANRARMAFRKNLKGSDAWLWPNNVSPSAKVIAGTGYEIFGFADYVSKQKFALTADGEHLDMHGQEVGLARKPARNAEGSPAITLATAGDCSVAAGAIFQRGDGAQYRATTTVSRLGAGVLDVPAVAVAAGIAGNAIGGTALDIVSGVTGDATAEIVADGIVGGADVEQDGAPFTTDLATFRGRILFRKRNPPHGGAPADYVTWCAEVPGVTRVFVERRWSGVGTVRVFPFMDGLYANGIPDTAGLALVRDYLEIVAPAGAVVTVDAASAVSVDLTVTGFSPNTTMVQEAALTELRAAFLRLARVAGIDDEISGLPFLAYPTSFSRSWLWQAIANATGETRHVLASPTDDVAQTAGQIPVLGTVSFSD